MSRSRIRVLLDSLAGSSYLGVGFNAFSRPEPGKLHPDNITVQRRFGGAAKDDLIKKIKRIRSKIPAHELSHNAKSRKRRHRRSSNS
jgi:hypothetical protein